MSEIGKKREHNRGAEMPQEVRDFLAAPDPDHRVSLTAKSAAQDTLRRSPSAPADVRSALAAPDPDSPSLQTTPSSVGRRVVSLDRNSAPEGAHDETCCCLSCLG